MSQGTLLQIDKGQARLGMFIHGFGKQWLNSPFPRNQFELTDPADLRMLRDSTVRTLIIDLSKGLGPAASTARPEQRPVDAATRQIASALTQTAIAVRSVFAQAASRSSVRMSQVDAIVDVVNDLIAARPTTVLSLNRLKTADETSFQHSVSVCALVNLFARHLKLDQTLSHSLCVAGLLHDIGKVHVPQAILKNDGALTEGERAVMRTHPRLGYELLKNDADLPDVVREISLHHHERPDGAGYPDGLADDSISRAVRIVTICDVFDALTTVRPYKTGWTPAVAGKKMAESHGQFDPDLLDEFFDCIGLVLPDTALIEASR